MQMTFITTLKPGKNIPFLNAVRSWQTMGIEVLVEGGNKEQAIKERYTQILGCKTGPCDLPYLDNLLHLAQSLSHGDFLVLTSDHLIFLRGLHLAIDIVSKQFDQFLIIGRHWELNVKGEIDFSDDWVGELKREINTYGKLGSPAAKDYFVFPKPLGIKFAPFLAGREWWDTWLLWAALVSNIPVVNVTSLVLAVHPRHAILSPDGTKESRALDAAGKYNEKLFWSIANGFTAGGPGSIDNVPYKIMRNNGNGWMLSGEG